MPLAQTPTRVVTDPRRYLTLIYGPPGAGKTSWSSQIPGHYFLCTEQGTSGVSVYGHNILAWDTPTTNPDGTPAGFLQTCGVLAESKAKNWEGERPVEVVIVDSYDMLWNVAAPHVMATEEFSHQGRKQKYAKPDDVPFYKAHGRISELVISKLTKLRLLGFGVILIARMKERQIKWRGQDIDTVDLQLSETVKNKIVSECDAVGYFDIEEEVQKNDRGEIVKEEKGRWQYWQPAFGRLGKHRLKSFPERIPLPMDTGWATYEATFKATVEKLLAAGETV